MPQFPLPDGPGTEADDRIDDEYLERRRLTEKLDSPFARRMRALGIEEDIDNPEDPKRFEKLAARIPDPEGGPITPVPEPEPGEVPVQGAPSPAAPQELGAAAPIEAAPAPAPAPPTPARPPEPLGFEADVVPGAEELFIGELPAQISGVEVLPSLGEGVVDIARGFQRLANGMVSGVATAEDLVEGLGQQLNELIPEGPFKEVLGGIGEVLRAGQVGAPGLAAPVIEDGELKGTANQLSQFIQSLPQIREPKSIVGGLLSGFAQFLPVFLPVMGITARSQALTALAARAPLTAEAASAALAGMFTDFAVFQGDDPRISEFANQGLGLIEQRLAANGINVTLQSKFLQWLAEPTDVADDASEFERAVVEIKGRTKNLIEGALIGTLFDSIIIGGRAVRRANLIKRAEKNLVRASQAVGERGAVRRGPTGRLPTTEAPFPTATLGPQREVVTGRPETAVRDVTFQGGASHMLLSTDPNTGQAFISGASTLPTERGKGFNKFTILAAINEGERATGQPVLLGHPRVTGETLTPVQRKNFETLEREGFMITEILDEARPDRRVAVLTDKGKRAVDPVFRAAADVPDLTAQGGGATYNSIDGNLFGKERFSVSIYPEWTREVDHLDGAVVREYMENVAKGGTFGGKAFKQPFPEILTEGRVSLGTWRRPADGKIVLDIVVTPSNMDEAMALGRMFNQEGIFDLRPGIDEDARFIGTGGNGTVPPELLEDAPMDRFQRVVGKKDRGEEIFSQALAELSDDTRQAIRAGELKGKLSVKGKPGTIRFNDEGGTKLANLGAAHIAAEPGRSDLHKWSKAMLEEFPPDERGFADEDTMNRLFQQSAIAYEREYNKAVRVFVADRTERLTRLGEGADLPKGLDKLFAFPVVSRLMFLFKKGEHLKHWYEGAVEEIIKFYGKQDGLIYARLLAALSPQTSPPENVANAIAAFAKWKKGDTTLEEIAIAAKQINPETGKRGSNVENIRRAISGEELEGPKVTRFLRAIMGDPNAVTPDRWMGRIFGFGELIGENEAQFIESWVRIEARKLGVAPRDMQAAMWTGVKLEAGLSKNEILEPLVDIIRRNLDNLNVPHPPGMGQAGRITLATNWILARTMVGAAIGTWTGDTMEEKIQNGLIGAGLVNVPGPVIKTIAKFVTSDALDSIKKPLRRTFNRSPRAAKDVGEDAVSPHMIAADRLREIADEYHRELEKMRRGTITREQTEKLADEALARGQISRETLNELMPGAVLNSEEAVATIKVLTKSGEQLQSLSQIVQTNPGDKDAVREFMKQLYVHGQIDPKRLGVITELGRALGAMNEPASGMNRFLKQFEALFGEARGGRTPDDLARMISSFDTLEQSAVFARSISKPSLVDAWLELWVNSLLWGPKTQFANIVSNTAFLVWSIPERGTAALFRGGRAGGVAPGEAGALMFGYMGSIMDGWNALGRAFRTDTPAFGRSKMEGGRRKVITRELLNATGAAGKAIDFIGEVVRGSGRSLMAADEFFKAVVFRGELRAQAFREAYDKVIAEGLEGAEAVARMHESMNMTMANPPASIVKRAEDAALYQTFTDELTGLGAKIQELSSHPAGRFVLPFVRTPANIARATVERTPAGVFLPSVQRNLTGSAADQSLAIARLSLGSLTMGMVGLMAVNGFITGEGPSTPSMKAQWIQEGWEPNSFRLDLNGDGIPDTPWISYGRLEPIGGILSLAATTAEILADIPEGDTDLLQKVEFVGFALAQAMAKVISSKTFLRGMSQMSTLLTNPKRGAGIELRNIAVSLIPFSSALRQVSGAIDPELKEIRNTLDALRNATPWLTDKVPPRRNLFGEPVSTSSMFKGAFGFLWNLASPINVKGAKDPKTVAVYKEIFRLNKTLGKNPAPDLPRTISRITLEPNERDRWAVLIGTDKLGTGETLKTALFNLVTSKAYLGSPDKIQLAWISQKIEIYRELSKTKLRSEFSVLDRSIRAEVEAEIMRGMERKEAAGI